MRAAKKLIKRAATDKKRDATVKKRDATVKRGHPMFTEKIRAPPTTTKCASWRNDNKKFDCTMAFVFAPNLFLSK